MPGELGLAIRTITRGAPCRDLQAQKTRIHLPRRLGDGGPGRHRSHREHTVRYFNISGGLTIKGSGSERHCFHISSPWSGDRYFYNAAIDRLSVEGVGGDGLPFDGKWGGASDIRVVGGYARNNRNCAFRYNNGTVAVVRNTQCTWEAISRSGPSPRGDLDSHKRIDGA